ncbi:tRNA pseudouridine(13) synthase TruD [Halospeciosus flavus]|uniref:Probable tRNA pseudouridine synthase D n=1 Tax=Halospeciosus flavus TaxID=3032283 RepID=A0ABD5Z6J9_9EURY|nr:tRNA pseudouridine(13) synthase TruD [Halospeciosus flavus]
MREAHPVEQAVGIEYYVSETDGVGGRLRDEPEDFEVREVERFETQPLDADTGDYPHLVFRATLRNWDTNSFARELSNRLGISRERVSWAGTKDRRAVTTQLFSVDGIGPEDLPDVRDADLEPVGRAGRDIFFGDLAGNEFHIVVADPDHPENADEIVAELQAFGGGDVAIPNFFGQQRFGSRRPVTHKVGFAIVRGDWEGAVMAYIGNPSEHEPEETQAARHYVEDTRDWAGAIDEFPQHLRYERAVLNVLAENGGDTDEDFREALNAFSSNLRRFFVDAAQSYIFNRILSERLARGLPFHEPVAGDVVCFADTDAPGDFPVPDTDRLQRVGEDRVDVVTRHCRRDRAFVTAPLVGTETELADGEPGEIERQVLNDVGVESSDFDLPGDYHSEGTRRAVLVRPHPEWEQVEKGLAVEFGLPKGSYATVVLREFMKVSPLEMS